MSKHLRLHPLQHPKSTEHISCLSIPVRNQQIVRLPEFRLLAYSVGQLFLAELF